MVCGSTSSVAVCGAKLPRVNRRGHAQRRIVFTDNQQQFIGRIGGVGDDAQQRLIGFRQHHAAHLLPRMANHDAVAFRQTVAQSAEGNAAIVRLDTQPEEISAAALKTSADGLSP